MSSDSYHEYIWSDAEIHAITERRLIFKRSYDYYERVRSFFDTTGALWVLKSVDSNSEELVTLKFLSSCPSSSNHTLPTEIIPCGDTCLIRMPFVRDGSLVLWKSIEEIYDATEQYLEGLQFMHRLGIAHLDIAWRNVVYAQNSHPAIDSLAVSIRRAYFIDFGCAKRFLPVVGYSNGSTVIPFPPNTGHYPPPEGNEAVNPYAYDMYCMGWVLNCFCRSTVYDRVRYVTPIRFPLTLWELSTTLLADNPNMRPSATHSLCLLRLMKIWVKMSRWFHWFLPYHYADGTELCGWRIISWIIHCSRPRRNLHSGMSQ
ncbi:kinase-like domain-containing protein [Irpex lacteus]|nr:kinase-like domain-containing protein [Irpex lacteus]